MLLKKLLNWKKIKKDKDLSRVITFLKVNLINVNFSVYLSGSYSSESKKNPSKDSDIDLFLFIDNDNFEKMERKLFVKDGMKGVYYRNNEFIDSVNFLLNDNYDIVFCNKRYEKSISQGMDLIYKHKR